MPDMQADITNSFVHEKVKSNAVYAQNLYAAMCNMQWQKGELWPILANELWTVSWRVSGGIIAELREQGGDYLDWYCSGMCGDATGHVWEGVITTEIEADLSVLGWYPVPYDSEP